MHPQPNSGPPSPQWVDLRRAARRLRRPWAAVLRDVRAGRIPARLIGGARWFIRGDAVHGREPR